MRKFFVGIVVGSLLTSGLAFGAAYRLTRTRAVNTTQINAFFQIAVDRGVWPGLNTDISELCGQRMASGGLLTVKGSRSGTDTQMTTDRSNAEDRVELE